MELKMNEGDVMTAMALARVSIQNERLLAEVAALQQKVKELEAKNGSAVGSDAVPENA